MFTSAFFFNFRPDGYRESRNEVVSWNPTHRLVGFDPIIFYLDCALIHWPLSPKTKDFSQIVKVLLIIAKNGLRKKYH